MTARAIHKLSAAKVAALVKAGTQGRHGDGGGLYLQIDGGSSPENPKKEPERNPHDSSNDGDV